MEIYIYIELHVHKKNLKFCISSGYLSISIITCPDASNCQTLLEQNRLQTELRATGKTNRIKKGTSTQKIRFMFTFKWNGI